MNALTEVDHTEIAITIILHAIGSHLAGVVSRREYQANYDTLQRLAGEGLSEAMKRARAAHAKYDAEGDAVFVAVLRAYGVKVADKFAEELGK